MFNYSSWGQHLKKVWRSYFVVQLFENNSAREVGRNRTVFNCLI